MHGLQSHFLDPILGSRPLLCVCVTQIDGPITLTRPLQTSFSSSSSSSNVTSRSSDLVGPFRPTGGTPSWTASEQLPHDVRYQQLGSGNNCNSPQEDDGEARSQHHCHQGPEGGLGSSDCGPCHNSGSSSSRNVSSPPLFRKLYAFWIGSGLEEVSISSLDYLTPVGSLQA